MRSMFFSFILVFLALSAGAQAFFSGVVTTDKGELLIGATVRWKDKPGVGTVTDTAGRFSMQKRPETGTLLITYVGFKPVSVSVDPTDDNLLIEISGVSEQLQGVEVRGKQAGTYVSTLSTLNVETITKSELLKAPCCNLAESFETNPSVDVSYSNAVTGATEIQLLGLRGIYTQLLMENRPALNGIATPFAMELVPGTWLESIQIAKGTGTVVNGYQAMTGQINAELMKPAKDKRFFVNLFANSMGRLEANVHLNKTFNKHWSSGVLLHGSSFQQNIDNNRDGFADMPLRQQLNGLYRLFYDSEKVKAQFNVQALNDQREGGLLNGEYSGGKTFKIEQQIQRIETTGKLAFLGLGGKPYRSVGSIFSFTWHKMDAHYGSNHYKGDQLGFYSNIIYSDILGTTDHKITGGLSLAHDRYLESVNALRPNRTETVPGAFAEYSYNRPVVGKNYSDITLMAGLRVDHNSLFGWLLTPRANFKYNFNENTIVRVSAGKGYRSPNVLAENISTLASNRSVYLAESLQMESSVNAGGNFTHNFEVFRRSGSISVDFYHTRFTNQVVVDMEQDYRRVIYYNLKGRSFSNSLLVTLNCEVLDNLELRLAFKLNDVKTTYLKDNVQRLDLVPLVARQRGLVTLDYKTPDKKWAFNSTLQIVGQQRLIDNSYLPLAFRAYRPAFSPVYALVNGQVTYTVGKRLEIYAGGENLTNYTQPHPIVSFENPDSPYFDASQIYAPMMGIRGYVGLRYGF